MLISEFLPNPKGPDTASEWIELYNNTNAPIPLSGWSVKDASGKKFTFKNQTAGAGDFFVLPAKAAKISLNNSNEKLFLYNPAGELVDELGFTGTAPEGKSIVRDGGKIIFTETPTPGKENVFKAEIAEAPGGKVFSLADSANAMGGKEIVNSGSYGAAILIGLAVAIGISFAAVFFLKKEYED